MMDKCIVKGCQNHKHQGQFVGDLCAPCHRMLCEGQCLPSTAWFAERARHLVGAAMADYLATWKALPEIEGYVKPGFDVWLARQMQNLDAAAATLESLEWSPMTSAPRDGTPVDLWTVRDLCVSNVRFIRAEQTIDPHREDDGWRKDEEMLGIYAPEQFTHWRHAVKPAPIRGPAGQLQAVR
jgi:hypothetical protein